MFIGHIPSVFLLRSSSSCSVSWLVRPAAHVIHLSAAADSSLPVWCPPASPHVLFLKLILIEIHIHSVPVWSAEGERLHQQVHPADQQVPKSHPCSQLKVALECNKTRSQAESGRSSVELFIPLQWALQGLSKYLHLLKKKKKNLCSRKTQKNLFLLLSDEQIWLLPSQQVEYHSDAAGVKINSHSGQFNCFHWNCYEVKMHESQTRSAETNTVRFLKRWIFTWRFCTLSARARAIGMRVRAGGGPPSCSRTVKQAQAAERAGRAANWDWGAQRERQNFSPHGKSPACRARLPVICPSGSSRRLWGIYFFYLLSLFFPPCVSVRRTHCALLNESNQTKDAKGFMT